MRTHLELSQKIKVATAILFNIKKEWDSNIPMPVDHDRHVVIRPRADLTPRQILLDGNRQHEILKDGMLPHRRP